MIYTTRHEVISGVHNAKAEERTCPRINIGMGGLDGNQFAKTSNGHHGIMLKPVCGHSAELYLPDPLFGVKGHKHQTNQGPHEAPLTAQYTGDMVCEDTHDHPASYTQEYWYILPYPHTPPTIPPPPTPHPYPSPHLNPSPPHHPFTPHPLPLLPLTSYPSPQPHPYPSPLPTLTPHPQPTHTYPSPPTLTPFPTPPLPLTLSHPYLSLPPHSILTPLTPLTHTCSSNPCPPLSPHPPPTTLYIPSNPLAGHTLYPRQPHTHSTSQ